MAEAKNNEVTVKKRKRKILWIIIPIALALIIVAGLVVTLLYNLFSFRDILFDAVYSLDPNYRAVEMLRKELDVREAELDNKEEQLLKDEQRLIGLEEKLDRREIELDEREIAIIPLYLRPLTDEELANMKSLSRVYSEMAPEDAAEILASLYSIDDMAAILYYMSEKSSAAILAVMERDLAVEITDVLLHY